MLSRKERLLLEMLDAGLSDEEIWKIFGIPALGITRMRNKVERKLRKLFWGTANGVESEKGKQNLG